MLPNSSFTVITNIVIQTEKPHVCSRICGPTLNLVHASTQDKVVTEWRFDRVYSRRGLRGCTTLCWLCHG